MARALGTTESITTCDCCGKSNLKLTVAVELDDGELVHYGTTCAKRNTGKTQKQINSEIVSEKARKLNAANAELISSAEYQAFRQKINSRPYGLIGMKAYEFIEAEDIALSVIRKRIAAERGLMVWELTN